MDSGGETETQTLEFQKLEEVFEDRDGDIFDNIMSFGSVH